MSTAQVIPLRPNLLLAGEANHRVANHLALLAGLVQTHAAHVGKGQAQLAREDVQALLREIAGRVVSVGQLHRRLIDSTPEQALDLGDYLIESSHALVKSLSLQDRVGIVHRLEARCVARPEQVQPIALIVGEIIMNAIKHAHPTGIPVEIVIYCGRTGNGRTLIEIADDGVGFPENFDPAKDGGIGLKLIRQLAASAQAELEIESDSLGARFSLTLPRNHGAPLR